MRALVTGGVGFVGTNLIKRLLEDGYDVVSIDNYSSGNKENHQEGCRYWDYDLTDNYCAVLERNEYDIIFHMAALARIQPSIKNPHKTILNNFVSALNVLETARKNNVRFVYAGSSSFHHGLYESPYAWSKHSGEQLCKLYSNIYDLSTVVCRFYNVYGLYGEYDWHIDANRETQPLDVKLTCLLNLSEEPYEGGEFCAINSNDKIKFDSGMGLVLNSLIAHKVTPVTKGKRITLTYWAIGPSWR